MKTEQKAYAQAGVDVDLANRVRAGLGPRVKSTHRPEVLSQIGGFGGLFDARFKGYKEPVLVSSIDGVGTKLKVAVAIKKHNTIGVDLVNHCVNDIAVVGAEPLFFLDYIGMVKADPVIFNQVIDGIVQGCKSAGCALIGGETAQMGNLYQENEYDLVGTIVGVVEKKKMIDGSRIVPGDLVIGLGSSGLHTNGYSLARRIFFEKLKMKPTDRLPWGSDTVADELLKTHLNYQPFLKKLGEKIKIKGLAHITGGGLVDNIPRILPKKTAVQLQFGSWPVLPIFEFLVSQSIMKLSEACQTFNMGIGMIVIVGAKDAEKVLQFAKSSKGLKAYLIGSVIKGGQQVILT